MKGPTHSGPKISAPIYEITLIITETLIGRTQCISKWDIQRWAKKWTCFPKQQPGRKFSQPRDHFLAQLCIYLATIYIRCSLQMNVVIPCKSPMLRPSRKSELPSDAETTTTPERQISAVEDEEEEGASALRKKGVVSIIICNIFEHI